MNQVMRASLWFIVPLAVAAVFFFTGLSRLPLEDADEATYAIVARELNERGEWARLTLFGTDWVDKPPLYLWSMVASAKAFGWSEGALRLPSALFGVIAVLFTALIAYELSRNKEAALFAALTLTLFPLFLAAARNIRMDVPVVASMLGALYFFIRGHERPWFLLGIGTCLGVGFLFKSVVALLIIPVLLFYALIYRTWSTFFRKEFLFGLMFGALVAVPWFLIGAAVYGDGFFTKFFGDQLGRVSVNTLGSAISNGYVLWVFLKYGMPWSLALLVGLGGYVWLAHRKKYIAQLEMPWRFATFALVSVVLLSLPFLMSTTKLITYFIPVYPFIVLFLAALYTALLERFFHKKMIRAVCIVLLAIAFVPSIREAFGKGVLYVSTKSYDEKAVGTLLAPVAEETPVLLYEFPHDQSLQYYADRRVAHLKEETAAALVPPFYLVMPTPLVSLNPWLAKSVPDYSGRELSVFHITR